MKLRVGHQNICLVPALLVCVCVYLGGGVKAGGKCLCICTLLSFK